MADESYLKTLAVLALKREGYAVKSDEVGVGGYGSEREELRVSDEGTFRVKIPDELTVWVKLPNGLSRTWKGTRLSLEAQLRKAMEGR